ncbi:MAG: sigma-70 family RNA polymerase sigma factor [Candidatus Latescibacterota bacterium]
MCLAWKRRLSRRQTLLGGLQIQQESEDPSRAERPYGEPDEPLLAGEQSRLVRAALRTLSTQTRAALELFYLEDLSLRQIAARLGLEENAVKQRLHWARRRLRKEMLTMPATTQRRQVPAVEPLLRFAAWGTFSGIVSEAPPFVRTRALLAQQILLHIARHPASVDEIAGAVGADRIYVLDHLSSLAEMELVRTEGEGRYLADFAILDGTAQEALAARSRQIGRRDAGILSEHAAALRAAFAQTSLPAQGFAWDGVSWLVLGVLTASYAVGRACPEIHRVGVPLRPDGNRWFLFGSTPGVQSAPLQVSASTSGEARGVGCWSTRGLPGPDGWLPDPPHRDLVHALQQGARPEAELLQDGGQRRTALAELLDRGWVVKDAGQVRLAVPVFTAADDRALCPAVDAAAQEIVERSRQPGLGDLEGLLDELGLSHVRRQYRALRASVATGCSAYSLEAMVASGLLVPPAEPRPQGWGCWTWRGNLRLCQR